METGCQQSGQDCHGPGQFSRQLLADNVTNMSWYSVYNAAWVFCYSTDVASLISITEYLGVLPLHSDIENQPKTNYHLWYTCLKAELCTLKAIKSTMMLVAILLSKLLSYMLQDLASGNHPNSR